MSEQFEEKFSETPLFWKWVLWAVLILPLTTYVIYSTWETWPSLLPLALLGAVTVVGSSFYVARHLTDIDDLVRNRAIVAAILIEIAMLFNAIAHGGGARAFENAKVGEVEREKWLNLNAQVEAQRADNLSKINQSEKEKADAQARLEKQSALRTDAETRQARLTGIRPPIRSALSPSSSPPPSVQWDAPRVTPAAAAFLLSPAQVLENWFWRVFSGLILELSFAVGGGLLVLRETLVDRDKNGIADYRERNVARSTTQRPSLPSLAAVPSAPLRVGAAPGGKPAVANVSAPGAANHPLAGTSAPTPHLGAAPGGNRESAPGPHSVGANDPHLGAAPGADLKQVEPGTGKGYGRLIIGREMPDIEDVEWEGKNSSGVIVAGWTPGRQPGDRRAPRLGQFGKTELARLDLLDANEFDRQVREQVEEWKIEKGVSDG